MKIILIETNKLYWKTQEEFLKLPVTPHKSVADCYRMFLENQGVTILYSKEKELVRNILGVAPGYDSFCFKDEKDYTWFLLKYS